MSWKPLRKIVVAGLSGLTTTGVVSFFDQVSGWEPSTGVASLIVTGAAVVAGYLTPEKRVSK